MNPVPFTRPLTRPRPFTRPLPFTRPRRPRTPPGGGGGPRARSGRDTGVGGGEGILVSSAGERSDGSGAVWDLWVWGGGVLARGAGGVAGGGRWSFSTAALIKRASAGATPGISAMSITSTSAIWSASWKNIATASAARLETPGILERKACVVRFLAIAASERYGLRGGGGAFSSCATARSSSASRRSSSAVLPTSGISAISGGPQSSHARSGPTSSSPSRTAIVSQYSQTETGRSLPKHVGHSERSAMRSNSPRPLGLLGGNAGGCEPGAQRLGLLDTPDCSERVARTDFRRPLEGRDRGVHVGPDELRTRHRRAVVGLQDLGSTSMRF